MSSDENKRIDFIYTSICNLIGNHILGEFSDKSKKLVRLNIVVKKNSIVFQKKREREKGAMIVRVL